MGDPVVEAVVVMSRGGVHRGYGFVEFATRLQAQRAKALCARLRVASRASHKRLCGLAPVGFAALLSGFGPAGPLLNRPTSRRQSLYV